MAVTGAAIAGWAAANAGTIALVSTAASIAATGYQFYSQQQQAKQEASAQEQMNKQIAVQAAASYDDLSPAEIDANRQAQEASLDQQAQAIQAKGRVNLFAAASGTMGGSVDSLLFDVEQQKSKNINSILTQRESGLYSIKQQAESIRQNAIGSQSRQTISQPSWIEAGLKLGSTAIQGFDKFGRMNETFKLQDKATTSTVKGGV